MIIKAFKNWLNRRAQKRSEDMQAQIKEFNRLSAKLVANQVLTEAMITNGIDSTSYAMHSTKMLSTEIAMDMLFCAQKMHYSNEVARDIMKHELYSVIGKVESEIGRPITDKSEVMKMLHNL